MSEREKFERYQAAKIGMDYKEIKSNLDEHERIAGERYGKKGQFAKEWEIWQAATAQAESEGCVVVPKKPTKNMINQGYEVHDGFFTNGEVVDVWEAMIQAAQECE